MKANSDIAPEIPEADFNEAKVAFGGIAWFELRYGVHP